MNDQEKSEFAIECDRRREAGLKLFGGGTYAIKDAIKAANGHWDGRLRCWLAESHDSAVALGGIKKKSEKHGVYYLFPKGGSGDQQRGEAPPEGAPSPAADLQDGSLCPACKSETLDGSTRPGVLYCWDCGFRK